jgi:hypothetical protein
MPHKAGSAMAQRGKMCCNEAGDREGTREMCVFFCCIAIAAGYKNILLCMLKITREIVLLQCSIVVRTPASYSRGAHFEFRLFVSAILTDNFSVS